MAILFPRGHLALFRDIFGSDNWEGVTGFSGIEAVLDSSESREVPKAQHLRRQSPILRVMEAQD